jgi:hypothetical protein
LDLAAQTTHLRIGRVSYTSHQVFHLVDQPVDFLTDLGARLTRSLTHRFAGASTVVLARPI